MRETCRVLLYFFYFVLRACVCMCAYVGGMHECVDVRGQRAGVGSPYHTVQGYVHIIRLGTKCLYPQSISPALACFSETQPYFVAHTVLEHLICKSGWLQPPKC